MQTDNQLELLARQLSSVTKQEERMQLRTGSKLPSVSELTEILQLIKGVLFPDFFYDKYFSENTRMYQIGIDLQRISELLQRQIARGYVFCCEKDESVMQSEATKKTNAFMKQLPEIKRLLLTDIEAVAKRDPAAQSYGEVVFSYPAIQVMLHHRIAHELCNLGIPIIPRIIAEQAHSATGIDIHPAATIGEYFAIDHGTGIVVGATTIIGNNVMLYQGVTLGAKNFHYDESGHPVDLRRHPIIEDNVTIYSNASILGRITIGHDSVIGGNVWLTHDIPPQSRILQANLQTKE